jgi:hypothetical protein
MNKRPAIDQKPQRWLLLIHQLPAKPAYLRVKLWRRLHSIGAVAIKHSVHALPANADSQEDFEWLGREIAEGGGEAIICEAKMIAGITDEETRGLFNAARDADYEEIAKEARGLAKDATRKAGAQGPAELGGRLGRLRARFNQVAAIDFFGANSREPTNGVLAAMEAALKHASEPGHIDKPMGKPAKYSGRSWVTRAGVHVDRIASAWLIKRFIDAKARFKFVPARGYKPDGRELRFDMAEGEFTHVGDRCTFEVLLGEIGAEDSALRAIGEIVHDIDLKDGKFARPQTEGIKTLIAGVCMASEEDAQRLKRGGAIFDDLYEFFRKTKGR